MTGSGRIERELARVYKVVDIVIFVADAIVVGFLLFLIGTVALVGTTSPVYTSTGGWVLSLIRTPGYSIFELLVYAVGALAIAGPIWHGVVRSSPETASSGASSIDDSSDTFEFVTMDESSSSEGVDSGVRTANGGRSLERVRNSPYQDGVDWVETVFDETAQSTRDTRSDSDRFPSNDALENDDDGATVEGESASTTPQAMLGTRPTLDSRWADQSGSNRETSNRSNESAPSTSMRQSSEIRDTSERLTTALSSSVRIQNLERQFEDIAGQSPIDEVAECIREKLEEGSDPISRIEPCDGDSAAMDEAVAEIRAQQRRIDSAFGTDFGRMVDGDGLIK